MGFFAEFTTWMDGLLSTYITNTSKSVTSVVEPVVVTVGAVYVMTWGFLQLTGKVEEPILEGVRRIAVLGVIFSISIGLWHYQDIIVSVFFDGPSQFVTATIGAKNFASVVDTIMDQGDSVANALLQKAGSYHWNLAYDLAAFAVWLCVGITAVYTMFLVTLAKVSLSVLLAIGPLVIPLYLFDATRKFLESWLAQLANYAFVAILSALTANLMLTVLSKTTSQAQSTGGGIQIAYGVRVCLAAGFTFLVMRQVLPMASALASGVALSSFGVVSSGLARGARSIGAFSRGMTLDKETGRFDSLSRMAGFHLSKGAGAVVKKVTNFFKPNSIGPK